MRFLLPALSFIIASGSVLSAPPVIYGEDNRREVYESSETWKSRAEAVAVLIHRTKLKHQDSTVSVDQKSFRSWLEELLSENSEEKSSSKNRQDFLEEFEDLGELISFCPEERFTAQPAPGDCTGFLIAPDLLLTAGHCAELSGFCEDYEWAFDFKLSRESKRAPESLPESSVFSCHRVIRRELNLSLGLDYALVQLDRRVKGREPLELHRGVSDSKKRSLTVVGSPSGLPLKVSSQGKVRDDRHPFFFVSTLDTYKGNSGSPVFNASTGLVEGVLVRGEDDFVPDHDRMCLKSKRCAGDECQGESVSRIHSVPEIAFQEFLMDAVVAGDQDSLAQFGDLGVWIDMPNRSGLTPLMQSLKTPSLATVEALLALGADPERRDRKGDAALHFLAPVLSENSKDILDLLLNQGADLERANDEGETPILRAARWLNLTAVKLLLEAGANPFARNNRGEGIRDLFEYSPDPEALRAIQAFVAEKNLAEHSRID